MKILSLRLSPYGCFADMSLDFTGGANLHLIAGSNESGKSTSLRAVRGLLFGIDERTLDNHEYAAPKLRIHGRLEGKDGAVVDVVRRKGRKNTLLNPMGEALDDTFMAQWLCGVDGGVFQRMFGLTHESLVEGGESLAKGEGALGQALFGAGVGTAMHIVVSDLERECRALFAKNAKKPPLNRAISEFARERETAREASLRPAEWRAVSAELKEARDALSRYQAQRTQLVDRNECLLRLKRTVPAFALAKECAEELRKYPKEPPLAPGAPQERQRAQSELRRLSKLWDKTVAMDKKKESALKRLVIPEELLQKRQGIEDLQEDLGAYKQAQLEISRLSEATGRKNDEILRMLGSLYIEAGNEELSQEVLKRARVTKEEQSILRELAQRHGTLAHTLSRLQGLADQVAEELGQVIAQEEVLPKPRKSEHLAEVIARVQEHVDLDRTIAALQGEADALQVDVERGVACLPFFQGTPAELCLLPVPSETQVEDLTKRMDGNESHLQLAERQFRQLQDKYVEMGASIRALTEEGPIPCMDDLRKAREAREASWEVICEYLRGRPLSGEKADELARSHAAWVAKADEIADRLREDGERVGRLSALTSEKEAVVAQKEELQLLREEGESTRRRLKRRWERLWKPAQLSPGTPEEMSLWLRERGALIISIDNLARLRRQIAEKKNRRDSCKTECDDVLTGLGEGTSEPTRSLGQVLTRCRSIYKKIEEGNHKCRQWKEKLAQLQQRKDDVAKERASAKEVMEAWHRDWDKALIVLGLGPDTNVAQMEDVLQRRCEVEQSLVSYLADKERLRNLAVWCDGFEQRAKNLARDCASELSSLGAMEMVGELVCRLQNARQAQHIFDELTQRRSEYAVELQDIRAQIKEHQNALDELVEHAQVADVTELVAMELACDEQRQWLAKAAQANRLLDNEGMSRSELEGEADGISLHDIPALLKDVARERQEAEREIETAHKRVARLEHQLASMDGSMRAAQAEEDAQAALALVRTHAHHYARLALARHILAAEMERYQKEHQRPLLARTSVMFSRMTLGAFSGVATAYNKRDERVLVCQRPTGQDVPMVGLSEGTRDQLFLALRLASLELHAGENEPLPLILDDLLINFDDERAAATLSLLAEVAKTTQVLFFTHHKHLLAVAETALNARDWRYHELGDPAPNMGLASL